MQKHTFSQTICIFIQIFSLLLAKTYNQTMLNLDFTNLPNPKQGLIHYAYKDIRFIRGD